VIHVADLEGKTYLESEAEVDEYLRALKTLLLQVIQSGQKARLQ
jgi:hypothetical protein